MCDFDSCEQLAKQTCHLCEGSFCSGHTAGEIGSEIIIKNFLLDEQLSKHIKINAQIKICSSCLRAVQRLKEAGVQIEKIITFQPEVLRVLRAAISTAALIK